jgi:hypothetical protein
MAYASLSRLKEDSRSYNACRWLRLGLSRTFITQQRIIFFLTLPHLFVAIMSRALQVARASSRNTGRLKKLHIVKM